MRFLKRARRSFGKRWAVKIIIITAVCFSVSGILTIAFNGDIVPRTEPVSLFDSALAGAISRVAGYPCEALPGGCLRLTVPHAGGEGRTVFLIEPKLDAPMPVRQVTITRNNGKTKVRTGEGFILPHSREAVIRMKNDEEGVVRRITKTKEGFMVRIGGREQKIVTLKSGIAISE